MSNLCCFVLVYNFCTYPYVEWRKYLSISGCYLRWYHENYWFVTIWGWYSLWPSFWVLYVCYIYILPIYKDCVHIKKFFVLLYLLNLLQVICLLQTYLFLWLNGTKYGMHVTYIWSSGTLSSEQRKFFWLLWFALTSSGDDCFKGWLWNRSQLFISSSFPIICELLWKN